jgi:hypothetical protein
MDTRANSKWGKARAGRAGTMLVLAGGCTLATQDIEAELRSMRNVAGSYWAKGDTRTGNLVALCCDDLYRAHFGDLD